MRRGKPPPARPLTAKRVERLTAPGRYHDRDERGLYLQVVSERNRSWVYRFERDGKEFMMGLGPAHTVSLKLAREKARAARLSLLDGVNPLTARREARAEARLATASATTFGNAAQQFFDAHARGWSRAHAGQWSQSVLGKTATGEASERDHCALLRPLPVAKIDTGLVIKVIEPLWNAGRIETGARVRGRIEAVLAWATVRNYRSGDNPARWRNHLDKILPAPTARPEHFKALPYDQVPALMRTLAAGGIADRALAFLILTATRTEETLGTPWDEIDFTKKLWTIPAPRHKTGKKTGKPLLVPLSSAALELLRKLPREAGNPYVFIGTQAGSRLGVTALLDTVKRLKLAATVHGMRGTFKGWAHEQSRAEHIVIEMALGHAVGNAVERAYLPVEIMEKRRALLQAWGDYCMTDDEQTAAGRSSNKVVLMRRAKRSKSTVLAE
jgi:integrase